MTVQPTTLPEDTVRIWLLDPDALTDGELLQRYRALLSKDELERMARFRTPKLRHDFLVARALVRVMLAAHTGIAATALTFEVGEHGRPELATVHGCDLRFNLSHTRGLIGCGVTRGRDLGVDVETQVRRTEVSAIADRFFSQLEVDALLALPEEQRRGRFFEYWTLKEAYIKARGLGLAIPLGQFSFLLDAGPPIRVALDPRLGDEATTWQFHQEWRGAHHSLAVAVRRQELDLEIEVHDVVPLLE